MAVQLLTPRRFGDDRGWFSETYSRRNLAPLGIGMEFVQDNHSLSRPAFTLRGLHYQAPPHAQAKLVRCIRGSIWDVAVDVRRASPTYGRHVAAELSAQNGRQLFVPVGFLHGFLTLEPDTEVAYKASDYYAPECDGGIAWDDPDLALPWPLAGKAPLVSDKDMRQPGFSDFFSPFAYDGTPLEPLA